MTAGTGIPPIMATLDAGEPGVLDPQVRKLLDNMTGDPLSSLAAEGVEELRRAYRESRQRLQAPPAAVAEVREIAGPTSLGSLSLRLYKPFSFRGQPLAAPMPCLVYFHGGGFVLGDLDSHDGLCRALALQGQCAVMAVDYRLAPEHRFPAAAEDAIAAVRWVRSRAGALGLDAARMAVGGDSAGGNLAAVAALGLREEQAALALQLLLYPITDMAHDLPSHRRLAQGYGLTREALLWFRSQYLGELGGGAGVADWRISPLRAASHAGLPPACIITAGFDPLLDEGRAYAERLLAAGVAVTYECFSGAVHGFALMTAEVAAGRHAIYRAGQSLRAAFAGAPQVAVAPDARA